MFSPRTRRVKCLFPQTLTQERWNGREGVEARRPLLVSLLVFEIKAASNLKTSLSDQHPHWTEHASQHFRCRNLYMKLRSRSADRYVVAMLQFYLLIVFFYRLENVTLRLMSRIVSARYRRYNSTTVAIQSFSPSLIFEFWLVLFLFYSSTSFSKTIKARRWRTRRRGQRLRRVEEKNSWIGS